MTRTNRMLALLLLWWSAGSILAQNYQEELLPNPELLAEFRRYHEWTSGVSPDGRWALKIALAEQGNIEHGAHIWNIANGYIWITLKTSEPVGRFVWRPDCRAISYFAQSSKNLRRLFVWTLDDDRHREISIPVSYAQAIIKWSPDSRRLAFTSDQGGLVIVDTESDRVASALGSSTVRSFDWSGDSSHLAALTDERSARNIISIVRAKNGELVEKVPAAVAAMELNEVAWQGSPSFLVTVEKRAPRSKRASQTELYSIDHETRAATRLHQSSLKISGARWLNDQEYLWHERELDGTQAIVIGRIDSPTPKPFLLDGTLNFRAFLPEKQSIVAAYNSLKENALVTFPLDQSSAPVVLAGSRCPSCRSSTHEKIDLRDAGGERIPILLSRAEPGENYANAAIIRLHGGIPATNGWEQTQLMVNHGMHALHLVIREQTAAADLLQSCDYVHEVLGVPRDRIVVLGASTASRFVLEASLIGPEKFGIAMVIGVGNPPQVSGSPSGGHTPRLFAFHGEKDRTIAPHDAKAIIEEALGAEILQSPRGRWYVFPGEDHSLRRIESHAAIYSFLLSELGVYPRAEREGAPVERTP